MRFCEAHKMTFFLEFLQVVVENVEFLLEEQVKL